MTAEQSRARAPEKLLTVWAAVVILLELWGWLRPSGTDWGFHHLGYLPVPLTGGILLSMAALLIPRIRQRLAGVIEAGSARWNSMRRPGKRLTALAGVIAIAGTFWVARERTFFLGDGFLLARNIASFTSGSEASNTIRDEPLAGFLAWHMHNLLSRAGITDGAVPVQFLGVLSGIGFALILVTLSGIISGRTPEQVLVFLFVFAAGGSQLFFGYVETYAPGYMLVLAFATMSLAYIQNRISLLAPAAVFGACVASYLALAALFPAFGFLLWTAWKRREFFLAPVALLVAPAVALGLLNLCGYSLSNMISVYFGGTSHLLPLGAPEGIYQSYSLASAAHLTDLLNLGMLIHPFAVPVLAFGIFGMAAARIRPDPATRFMLVLGACGFIVTAALNLELGMSRDWDLLAPFSLCVVLAAVAVWTQAGNGAGRRAGVLVAGVAMLHLASWISVNASQTPAMNRIEALRSPWLWSKHALMDIDEELSIFLREQGEPRRAIAYLESYLAIDSTNSRLWASLAKVSGEAGDSARELNAYEHAVRLHSTIWETYINLGHIYSMRNRDEEALAVARQGLALNPETAFGNNLVGVLILSVRGTCRDALPYFEKAIRSDTGLANAWFNAGACYLDERMYAKSEQCLERFLGMSPPAAAGAEDARRLLRIVQSRGAQGSR